MDRRLVLLWVAFAVLVNGWMLAALQDQVGYFNQNPELVWLIALLAAPSAQWLALRIAGVAWRWEWFIAGVAGQVFSAVVVNVVQSSLWVITTPLPWVSIVTAIIAGVLQWAVLRAHVRRAGTWFLAIAGSLSVTVILRGMMTGWIFFIPVGTMQRLTLNAAAALVEGAMLAWLVTQRREDERSLATSPIWFVVEWTAAACAAVLLIFGGTTAVWMAMKLDVTPMSWHFLVLVPTAGAVIGIVQWWLLRDRVSIGTSWIAVSVFPMALPGVVLLSSKIVPVVGDYAFVALTTPYTFAIIGGWLGVTQWLVLRRHVPLAFLWVPATAAACLAWRLRLTTDSLTISVIAGLVSGTMMAWLLRESTIAVKMRGPSAAWAPSPSSRRYTG